MHAFWTLCSWALVTVCMRQLSTRTSKIAAHCLHFLYACMVLCPTAGSVTTSRASQPAVSIILQRYNKCLRSTNVVAVSARRSQPAAVVGLPLRARQAWSMRGPWNIHGTMRYATSRLSSYVPSYSYLILSRSRSVGGDARASQKVSKRQSGAMRVEGNRVHIPQMWLIRLHRPIRVVCHFPGQSN